METPYTQFRRAQFRGPTTSDDYNARIEEYYRDLVVLVNRARLSEIEIDDLFRRMAKEHIGMMRVISDLEARVDNLEAGVDRFAFFDDSSVDVARFDGHPTYSIPVSDRLSYDTQHGLFTLPKIDTSSLSKLLFTNTEGEDVIAPSFEARVVGTETTADNTTAIVDTSPPELALYRQPGRFWERNVVVSAPDPDGAEVTLYVKVPTELYTTDSSNVIVLHPFPAFGTIVREVSYTLNANPLLEDSDGYIPLNSGRSYEGETNAIGWVAPGGWTGSWAGQDAAVDVGPRAFYFSPKAITALRIRLAQDTYYYDSGNYVYSYGLSQLDLRYDKFLSEGRTILRFDAPEGGTISGITNVQPQIWNVPLGDLDDVFSHRAIWETAFNSGEYTLDEVPNSQRVWIEVTLRNTEGWTPALSGLVIDYEAGSGTPLSERGYLGGYQGNY